jgi:hypothetical protein
LKLQEIKKQLENILNTHINVHQSEGDYYSYKFKTVPKNSLFVNFNTNNGCIGFSKEQIQKCKDIFENKVICEISRGESGVKEDIEWTNPFDKKTTERLEKIGYTEFDLEDSYVQNFINKHGIENLEKGYLTVNSYESSEDNLIYNSQIVARFGKSNFKNTFDARMIAKKEGIKFIEDIPHLPKHIYLDTPENRKIIEESIKKDKIFWTIENYLYELDKKEENLKTEETTRYKYEKEYGKVNHVVWIYIDKNNYTKEEQEILEEKFELYKETFASSFIYNKEVLIEHLDKNRLEYDLIKSLLEN